MTTPSFDIKQYFKTNAELIEKVLDQYLLPETETPQTLHMAMRYAIMNGGKRFRPVLAIATTEMLGGNLEDVIPGACALEMIHGYSLVHDDLPCMDNDELRRGKPTTHKKFGPATAMLTGNALICRAFEILGQFAQQTKLPPKMAANIIVEIARASGMEGMVGGQVADMESEGKTVTTERLAFVHAHKTGALIRSAVRIGGFASNTSPSELDSLTAYAEKLGLLFQVTDDILDVEGKEEERGKKIGGDIALDKATYPKIHGMSRAKELVQELMDGCRTDLSSFGDRASVLIAIANYVATRKA